MITGFRLGFGGATEHFGIVPDILTYGKIIGGGLPVGAYASSNEIMSCIAPDGDVYQAGTLSGNPVAMAAGIAQLQKCLAPGFYETLQEKTARFTSIIDKHIFSKNYEAKIIRIGSIFWLSFSTKDIKKASEIDASKMSLFGSLHQKLIQKGVYLGPSGYEVGFVSGAHNIEDLNSAANTICNAMDEVL